MAWQIGAAGIRGCGIDHHRPLRGEATDTTLRITLTEAVPDSWKSLVIKLNIDWV